jgi:hypothetical protein
VSGSFQSIAYGRDCAPPNSPRYELFSIRFGIYNIIMHLSSIPPPADVINPDTDPAGALVALAADLEEGRQPAPSIISHFSRAVEAWLQGNPLEQALRLRGAPGIDSARTTWHRRQRHAALREAYDLIGGKNPSQRFRALAEEIVLFEDVLWPVWRHEPTPPPGASRLRQALFRARRHGPLPGSERGLWKICLQY